MIQHDRTSGIRTAPAPFKAGVSRVLIFGGTFDPPTRAHLELPRLALVRSGADQLVYVPAGRSPHKRENPEASDADRVAMLCAALSEAGMGDVAAVSTIEIDPEGGSPAGSRHARPATYTIDTLRSFRSALPPGTVMRLLMGADQALSFHRWRDPRVVMALAEPMVMLRRPAESVGALVSALREHWPRDEAEAWRRRVVELDVRDVSSTDVRALLREGGDGNGDGGGAEVSQLLTDSVRRYIEEHGLYRRGGR
ncbi:MAG: nicotinate-nicotinamide nucleotide adenylyltransferase [Phycisphaerales bacterium]